MARGAGHVNFKAVARATLFILEFRVNLEAPWVTVLKHFPFRALLSVPAFRHNTSWAGFDCTSVEGKGGLERIRQQEVEGAKFLHLGCTDISHTIPVHLPLLSSSP